MMKSNINRINSSRELSTWILDLFLLMEVHGDKVYNYL